MSPFFSIAQGTLPAMKIIPFSHGSVGKCIVKCKKAVFLLAFIYFTDIIML